MLQKNVGMEALSKWIRAGAIFQHPQISHLESQNQKNIDIFLHLYTQSQYCLLSLADFKLLDFLADAFFNSFNFIACSVDSGSKKCNLLTFNSVEF